MALTPEELELQRKITKELEAQARLRLQLSSSIEKYLEGVEDLKHKQKVINDLEKQMEVLTKKKLVAGSKEEKQNEIKLAVLKEQQKIIQDQHDTLEKALVTIKKSNLVASEMGESLGKGALAFGKSIGNLDKAIVNGYNKLKGLGLFDMDKAIKQSALQMGVLSKEAVGYRTSIKEVAKRTSMIGIGVKELTELQANYTDELGRNVMMSEKGMEAMGEIAAATGLGAQGTAQMAADMENVGLSTERVGDFVNLSLSKSHKMGLNATKVLKNLTGGMKLLNRYNFKDGLKGLEKMARTVTKLGVGMEFAAGMADKLWNVEGAVDLSAQLQVMGGEFAKMADPFHLMYMARNDIEGLTEELGNAAAASAKFNKKTGEFDISAMEMHRLKIIAEQTGIEYDDLAKAGKNAAKFTKIKSQLNFSVGGGEKGKEMQDFITNKSFLNEKGKAFIKIGNDPKLLSQLTSADKTAIKAMMDEEQNMKKRAEESKTFDETLENFINGLKITLMPFIEAMEPMIGGLQNLSKKFFASDWPKKIEDLAGQVGGLVSTIGGWIIDNPIESAMIYAGTKLTGFFFDKLNWFANGLALSKGFNKGVSVGGTTGGGGGTTEGGGESGGGATGGGGKGWKNRAKTAGKGALGGLAMGAINMGIGALQGEDTFTGGNIGNMIGSVLGGAAGTFLDPFIGPLGTILGAQLGGMLGEYVGGMFEGGAGDAVFNSPIHDGKIGSDFSKGRGIMQGGKITPIDNKDDLLAMKKGGPVDKVMNQESNVMKVDFGDITINGKIEVFSPGNTGMSVDLMKDPSFRRDIARVVSSEIEKNRNGGKNKG